MEKKKNKRFFVRNLVWNKHMKNVENSVREAELLLENLKADGRISYCIFTIERGKNQDDDSYHFQGYLEFDRVVDAVAFNKNFNFTDIQTRKGTQQQAIDYVLKKKSKISDKIFDFGTPKVESKIRKWNTDDKEIPPDLDSQRILLDKRLAENYYQEFADIKKDFTLLFLKYEKWCKNLWEKYHPIKVLDVTPLTVLWLEGPSGVGKTTWTNEYLKEKGFIDADIAFKKASSESDPKLWFNIADEGKKVLWIEEVRLNFPNYNDMLKFIDRRDYLPVKGSMIKNTFELIIVNSLLSPEMVYSHLPNINKIEILRRIYGSTPDNKVLRFSWPDNIQFKYPPVIEDVTNDLPNCILDFEHPLGKK